NIWKTTCALVAAISGALGLNATAQTQFTNEVWISTNATGKFYGVNGASGTLSSPLDGSSQVNFDDNMMSLPPNCTVHILAGTYLTAGAAQWELQSGQKILGSGIDVTILKASTGGDGVTVLGNGVFAVTNVEISDLTCDANSPGGGITRNGIIIP